MVKVEWIFRGSKLKGCELLLDERKVPFIPGNGLKERFFNNLDPELDLTLFLHHINYAKAFLPGNLYVFVNIKPETLLKFWTEVLSALKGKVVLELREDMIPDSGLERLAEIRKEYMFLLSIDDFGVKASNIDRIRLLEPNFIKLDVRLFRNTRELFDLVIFLRDISGASLVAECVESEEHFRMVRAAGIEFWGGFYGNRIRRGISPREVAKL